MLKRDDNAVRARLARAMTKPKRFTGDLATPIRENYLVAALSRRKNPQATEQESERIRRELARKLLLLAEHYGIDTAPSNSGMGQVYGLQPDSQGAPIRKNWTLLLLLRLAEDFVPGLRVVPRSKRGRGRTRKDRDKAKLYDAVEELRKNRKNLSVESACAHLAKQREWKGRNGPSLKTSYYEFKRKLAAFRKLKQGTEIRD